MEEMSFFDTADRELTSRLTSDCMAVYSYLSGFIGLSRSGLRSDVLSFFLRSGAVTIFRREPRKETSASIYTSTPYLFI